MLQHSDTRTMIHACAIVYGHAERNSLRSSRTQELAQNAGAARARLATMEERFGARAVACQDEPGPFGLGRQGQAVSQAFARPFRRHGRVVGPPKNAAGRAAASRDVCAHAQTQDPVRAVRTD